MAKDYLNVIERALMMGVSDKINNAVTGDVYIHGQYPESEELKFPSIIIQQVASGFEEKYFGEDVTFGAGSTSSKGEVYGIAYNIHIICEKDTEITIGGDVYKQRRLLNWIMLNVANEMTDLDFDDYQEETLEITERRLLAWRDIGFMPEFQWYGASCDYTMTFKNYRD